MYTLWYGGVCVVVGWWVMSVEGEEASERVTQSVGRYGTR